MYYEYNIYVICIFITFFFQFFYPPEYSPKSNNNDIISSLGIICFIKKSVNSFIVESDVFVNTSKILFLPLINLLFSKSSNSFLNLNPEYDSPLILNVVITLSSRYENVIFPDSDHGVTHCLTMMYDIIVEIPIIYNRYLNIIKNQFFYGSYPEGLALIMMSLTSFQGYTFSVLALGSFVSGHHFGIQKYGIVWATSSLLPKYPTNFFL